MLQEKESVFGFKKFSSIEQFRHIVKDVTETAEFHGQPLPKITFNGTVKIHGTNAGVGWNGDKIIIQSRNKEISTELDNCGFAQYVTINLDSFKDLCSHFDGKEVRIYGEWCGKGIQKGVAVSELDKMFIIFTVTVDNVNIDFKSVDFSHYHKSNIHSIHEFQSWNIDIDFSSPESVQEKLMSITQQVEKCCPVGKHFGVSGVGEGVVWCGKYQEKILKFKVKGDKHSVVSVKKGSKTKVNISPEKLSSITEFINYAASENRMKQGLQEIEEKNIGGLIRWMSDDIQKEESDTLITSGLTLKDIKPMLSAKVRDFFMNKIN